MSGTILIVDDDPALRRALSDRLRSWGHSTESAADGPEALELAARREFDLLLLDLSMPGMQGMDVLRRLREEEYPAEVVVLTSYGSVESVVEAMKAGATDFLTKPADFELIRNTVERTLERRRMRSWRRAVEAEEESPGHLGESPAMRQLADLALRVAESSATVLITGESGSGKQVLAEFIHRMSPRRKAPFLHVNCVAISDTLIEATLFGQEKGAFTGAVRMEGRLEAAAGGTVFLDEIGDVTPAFQAKLLHFLDKGEFERVGGRRVISVDCRIIAATHRDLPAAVREGRFREDLFHRLNVVRLHVPSLQERSEDIPDLAQQLLARAQRSLKRGPFQFAPRTLELLTGHAWSGNVRQLENVIVRMVVLARSEMLTPDLLPPEVHSDGQGSQPAATEDLPLKEAVARFRREFIAAALAREDGNQTRAARRLGIQRTYLSALIKELDL